MDRLRAPRALQWLAVMVLPWGVVLALETSAGASPAVSENVPVPGGLAALARALDIEVPDHARCVPELARLVYGDNRHGRARPASPYRRLIAHLGAAGSVAAAGGSRTPDLVPVPLTAAVWSRAVFRRPVTTQTLFAAILSDPDAALLAHGLSALDDETLQFFADHPALLTTLYQRHASVFASFVVHLRIRNNRVVLPAGDLAVPLWEAVLHERVTDPVAFVTALYARAQGRMAYLYDVIGHLDGPRAAFALGLWLPDQAMRVERFQALSHVSSSAVRDWNATNVPFSRPAFDLLALFLRVQVERSGAPRFPASQRLWRAAIPAEGNRRADERTSSDDDRPIDAAWLAAIVLSGHGRTRSERLDQLAFGQRAFASAQDAATPDLIAAIGSVPRVPMLMLTLERIGLQQPGVYAALARHAQRLTRLKAIDQPRALAQFQSAVALIARMVRVQTIDRATAEQLLIALASGSFDETRGYMGAVASWLEHHVRPAIGAGAGVTFDEALVQALAGRAGRETIEPLSWEGRTYVFDLPASEARRLRRFLERRRVSSLDATMQIHGVATTLAAGATGVHAIGETIAELRHTLSTLPNTARAVQQLTEPLPRAEEVARGLLEAVDALTADTLLSFAYAIEWTDPQGPARLDRELPRRHDFGLTATSRDARAQTPWALPRLVFQPGQPWRVEGAVLGLEVALASLALRKIDLAPPSREPAMLTTNRDSFVASLGLLNVFALRDVDGDAIAEAVARGQRRVDALSHGNGDATAVIDAIAMDGWRARALRWSLLHAPDRVPALFSMTEFLHLGGGGHLDVHAWGMSALDAFGCLCTHTLPPGLHTALVGRHHVGLLPVTVPDLNLRVAVVLRELKLPAALARNVLEAALHDFLADVSPMHLDDWLALVRRARGVPRERLEDYLAAATAAGGPLSSLPLARRRP